VTNFTGAKKFPYTPCAQDASYVGNSRSWAHRKTPILAADLLNDRAIPFVESHDLKRPHIPTGGWTPAASRLGAPAL
jgi:hypothetical protein